MRRVDLAPPSGLIGRASAPVLLYRKGQPFIPFTSYPQFMIVLAIIFAVGIGALTSFQIGLKPHNAMHATLIGAVIGAAVGIIPSIIGGMPYGLRLNSPRPVPWIAFTRNYLVHSRFKKIEAECEPEKETWISNVPWWRVAIWSATTFVDGALSLQPECPLLAQSGHTLKLRHDTNACGM